MFTLFKTIPNFLKLPAYALDMSDLSYKFIRLCESQSGVTVSDFGEGFFPTGAIENGDIKDRAAVLNTLKDVFKKHGIRFVALALPDEKGFVRSIKLPSNNIKREEIGEALGLQLEEYIPLSAADVVYDHVVLKEDKEHFDVVLRALPKQVVDSYLSLIEDCGAWPVLVWPELSAIVRAISPPDFEKTGMLLDWGLTRTSFAIFTGATVRFSSTIPIGGAMLTDAIAKSLRVSASEAVHIKEVQLSVPRGLQTSEEGELFQAVVPLIASVRGQAEEYIRYWVTHSEDKGPPSHIFLSGGDTQMPGFAEYLSTELHIPVSEADPWANVRFPARYLPELSKKDALRFVSAIGLGVALLHDSKFL